MRPQEKGGLGVHAGRGRRGGGGYKGGCKPQKIKSNEHTRITIND